MVHEKGEGTSCEVEIAPGQCVVVVRSLEGGRRDQVIAFATVLSVMPSRWAITRSLRPSSRNCTALRAILW